MEDRIKLPLSFDPERLQDDLRRLEASEWIDHFVTRNYTGSWSVIPLRAPAGAAHPVMTIFSDPACDTFVDTPCLERCGYLREVLALVACPLDAVRLMKLSAGSVIKEHRDHDLAFEQGHVRLHVPVRTNPGVEFVLNGRRIVMSEGECWYLRLSDPHAVANRGATDRVHLVIDARVNAWIETMLHATDTVGRT